jgi:hypothetical protein
MFIAKVFRRMAILETYPRVSALSPPPTPTEPLACGLLRDASRRGTRNKKRDCYTARLSSSAEGFLQHNELRVTATFFSTVVPYYIAVNLKLRACAAPHRLQAAAPVSAVTLPAPLPGCLVPPADLADSLATRSPPTVPPSSSRSVH